ncbi:Uncharacterised protein [Mycobacterium tuberculosis]|nr:Uncharacterised protein [Mycobacterium tuberculosis]
MPRPTASSATATIQLVAEEVSSCRPANGTRGPSAAFSCM